MFLLVLAHPGCPGQTRKMVVVVVVLSNEASETSSPDGWKTKLLVSYFRPNKLSTVHIKQQQQ